MSDDVPFAKRRREMLDARSRFSRPMRASSRDGWKEVSPTVPRTRIRISICICPSPKAPGTKFGMAAWRDRN